MLRRHLRLGAFILAFLMPAAVPAQTSFVVMGGLSAPVSRLGDLTDMGYNVTAGLNVGALMLPVGLRFEADITAWLQGWGRKRQHPDRHRERPHQRWSHARRAVSHRRSRDIQPRKQRRYGNSRTVLGVNGGGGLRFALTGISTFFEARYHIMLGNASEASNYQFIPITFGIQF